MTFDPRLPYDALPALPPRADVETAALLKRCLTASRALAELKSAGDLIPDQAILINAIPLQEARLSSEIENIVTTQDELFRATLDDGASADAQTKEVLRYRTALRYGYEQLARGPLSMDLARDLYRILRGDHIDFRGAKEQVVIVNRATGKVTYTPPKGGPGLVKKLRNLESYLLAKDGPDPMIRMVVAHYQFEAIHPFMDGNGRAGRILNILYLVHAGLLKIPVMYFSRFIIQHKADYYRLLRQVTEKGAWEPPLPTGMPATCPRRAHDGGMCPKRGEKWTRFGNVSTAWTCRVDLVEEALTLIHFTESTVEDAARAWLEAIGWQIAHGLDMARVEPAPEVKP